jgi:dihydroneopterin aldolase
VSDKITITGVEAHGYHGFFDFEREAGQPFVVDAELSLDLKKAGAQDELGASVDYNDLAILIHNEIKGPPFKIVEALAENICAKILSAYPSVDEVKLTVHKPRAPISVPFGNISITIKRSR